MMADRVEWKKKTCGADPTQGQVQEEACAKVSKNAKNNLIG